MKLNDVLRYLKKDRLTIVSKVIYQEPTNIPNRWAILNSPDYDKDFIGTLLIDLTKMYEWSINHAEQTWTSKTPTQQAKEYFPKWIKNLDSTNDDITLLDDYQREFLKAYDLDFIQKGWFKFWCPNCQVWHTEIKVTTKDQERVGKTSKWTSEWFCPKNHLLVRKLQTIRIISR